MSNGYWSFVLPGMYKDVLLLDIAKMLVSSVRLPLGWKYSSHSLAKALCKLFFLPG